MMTHQHLCFHLLHRIKRNAYYDDNRGAAQCYVSQAGVYCAYEMCIRDSISAAPSETIMCVREPAPFMRVCRSTPISRLQTAATISRTRQII